MIKAEIMKGGRTYVITFKDGTQESLEAAYEYALKIATGAEAHSTGEEILDLGHDKGYDHIKVWYEKEQPQVLPPNMKVGPPAGVPTWDEVKAPVNYLGQRLQIEIQEHKDKEGRYYWLPMFINGDAALDMVSSNKLYVLTVDALASQGLDPDSGTILTPHAPLPDWEEARAYIRDYIDETKGPYTPKKKNAKAWTGHYLDEKGGE